MSSSAAPYTSPEAVVISGGVGLLDGQRQQLGRFDRQDHGQGVLLFDAELIQRDEATGTWSRAIGRNLGLDSNREVTLDMERQGVWGVRLDYNEIPYQAPYTINSKTEGLGTTTQTIPKTAVAGDGSVYTIGTERERVELNTFRTFNQNIKFNVNFRNETKEGTRQWGRGSANELTLEPVEWAMRQLEPSIGYVGKDLQLLGGYTGSWFRNDNSLVDTMLKGDNPAILANHTYLSLPLSNEAHQIYVSGGYQFTPETRATFKLSYGRALQNEHLPTIDIAGLSTATAPSRLEGQVDTTSLLFGLTTRIIPDLTLTARVRYYD
ncbi:MAG: MtrB/PioB family outer membrane beta-barrel protein, partial [Magnetococcales bacterium]|nr:MtrB/PioB family outer membrane beta-barrel protein [Magnetococcales bacterium]